LITGQTGVIELDLGPLEVALLASPQ
jgi:hypothetical protein